MGKSSPKQRVVEYYMSLHYGICHGVVERFVSLSANEKVIVTDPDASGILDIDENNLFGGVKKEGGLSGRVAFQSGSGSQLLDSYCAAKLTALDGSAGTPTTVPAYRGIATAFFTERPGSAAGFYWSANQPYVPPLWFRVTRLHRDWQPALAAIPGESERQGIAVCFALDLSLSMGGGLGQVWLVARDAIIGAVADLRDSAYPDTIDIRIVGWNSSYTEMVRRNCTPADYEDLLDFVVSLTELAEGADFTQAVAGLPEFFADSGDKKRYFFFVSDGVTTDPDSVIAAAEVLDGIDSLKSYSYNSVVPATIYSEAMDNTSSDGVPVIPVTGDRTMASRVLSTITDQLDANPAHIIWEAMTNRVWGRGLPTFMMNEASFIAAAQTLFNERFGLSMIWVRQTELEAFVAEVLDHIQATLYVDPRTGRWNLKLIRDDYNPDDCLVLDTSNSLVESFKRRSPAETTGEIIVSWKNPQTEEDETVSAQSLGTIVINNGEIVSDSRNYYGVRRADLAAQLAARDLAAASAPLATAEVHASRAAWTLVPGDVIKLRQPEYADYDVLMRVTAINYGKPGASVVRLSLTEDVFSYAKPRAQKPPRTASTNTATGQTPAAPASSETISLNYYFSNSTITEVPTDLQSGLGFIATTTQTDASLFEVAVETVDNVGATVFSSLGGFSFAGRATLAATLEDVPTSAGVVLSTLVGSSPQVGSFVFLGGPGLPESEHEIAVIVAQSSVDGSFTLRRGALDTVPQYWPLGTLARIINTGDAVSSEDFAVIGDPVDYRFQTQTSRGLLSIGSAPVVTYAATDRYHAPARPANVKVQGDLQGPVDMIGFSGSVTVTWNNRNRLTEDTTVLQWTDGEVTPEVGQTTTIRLVDDLTGAAITEFTGLTGTSYSFAATARGSSDFVRVLVFAVRDGIESIQGREILMFFAAPPLSLFSGLSWLDVNVTSSIYQDAAGTIAVTADNDPVGLIENEKGVII